jgi:hypothetical protein
MGHLSKVRDVGMPSHSSLEMDVVEELQSGGIENLNEAGGLKLSQLKPGVDEGSVCKNLAVSYMAQDILKEKSQDKVGATQVEPLCKEGGGFSIPN